MLTRRTILGFGSLALAAPHVVWTQTKRGRSFFLSAVGSTLTLYSLDVARAELTKRGSIGFPVDVQYAWPHPTQPVLYVTYAELPKLAAGAPTPTRGQFIAAVRVDADKGELRLHGQPVAIPARANHISVDREGAYIFTSHPRPKSTLLVHRINADLSVGDSVPQVADLDFGIYAHQVRVTPSNKAVILAARGNDATETTPEDPGSLRVFRFDKGRLIPNGVVAPNGGYGFGPRHLDFHPSLPVVYVSLERQNALHVYRLGDGVLDPAPLFIRNLLEHPERAGKGQIAGTVHVHPNGKTVYCANRGDAENHGELDENNLVAFSLDPTSGEPTRLQTISSHGFHPRTFALDFSGKVLVAGNMMAHTYIENGQTRTLPMTVSIYRVSDNGMLEFSRSKTAPGQAQFWSGVIDV